MDEVYGVCPYCGFDAEAAVAHQSKQNDETLSSAEHAEEVEFYLYESHPDFCEGMRNSIKEADYTIDMINSHGVKWSGNITEKKDGYKKYSADYEYHYNMSSKYAGSDVLDTLRNSSDTTKAEAIDWLIDNGFLHSDEQYNAAYVLALGDAIGISDDDWDSETFEATDWNLIYWVHGTNIVSCMLSVMIVEDMAHYTPEDQCGIKRDIPQPKRLITC